MIECVSYYYATTIIECVSYYYALLRDPFGKLVNILVHA